MKISSMLILKYRASLNANVIEGLYRPFSNEPMVCRDTSSAAASSSCLIPRSFRISSKRFSRCASFLWKASFPYLYYSKRGANVKYTFHSEMNFFIPPIFTSIEQLNLSLAHCFAEHNLPYTQSRLSPVLNRLCRHCCHLPNGGFF